MITLRKQLVGDALVIAVFGALALALHLFGDHLAERTRALRADGVQTQVRVAKVLEGLPRKVVVAYEVDGRRYQDEVFAWDPPPRVGVRLLGWYRPGEPADMRIRPLDEATIEEDRAPFRRLPLLLLAPMGLIVLARGARLTGREPSSVVGPFIGLLLTAVIVGVNFTDEVRRTIDARLGSELVGLPAPIALSILEALVLGPLLVLWAGAAVALMTLARKTGSLGPLSFILWVVRSDAARALPAARRRFLITGAALIGLIVTAGMLLSLTD